MKITLKTNEKEITSGIMNISRSKINNALHLAANDIRKDVIGMIEGLMTSSPEYKSLLNGDLRAEFGLRNPQLLLDDIVDEIKQNVNVSVVPVSKFGPSLNGGISISVLKNGVKDLLSLSSGKYEGDKFDIPWLEWLLTKGDRIIIAGYDIKYDISPAERKISKSGVAIMEKGGGWRVPPVFSGTEDSNWITRVFDINAIKNLLDSIIRKNLQRRI